MTIQFNLLQGHCITFDRRHTVGEIEPKKDNKW